jgi:hypothetical protein
VASWHAKSELPPAVAGLCDAANRHAIEAFLASFTEDGVVDDRGRESVAIHGQGDHAVARGDRGGHQLAALVRFGVEH